VLLSPFAVIALGHGTARLAGPAFGAWAWVPVTLVLWACFAACIALGAGGESARRWLRTPGGGLRWLAIALAVGLIPLPILLSNYALLDSPLAVLLWLAFAAINPFFEEGYWRGVLLDSTASWPAWASILFASSLFALNHPLTFGVISLANAHPATLVSTFIMGVGWAVVYRRTGSLRWPILAHVGTDLCNLAVLAMMNIYLPVRG